METTNTAAPATDTAENTSTQTDGKTQEENVVQKYKLGEEEYDETTLKKLVERAKKADEVEKRSKEIEKGGRAKFEEAASLQKQFRQISEILHENPEAGFLEMAKLFKLPDDVIDRIAAQRSKLQQQWEKMNDDQKARYIAEQKARQLEEEKQSREQEESTKKANEESKAKQDAFEKKLAKDTLPKMQEAGLQPTHLKLKLVAATLGAIADRDGPDSEPDIEEAIAYVAEAYNEDLDSSVKGMDPEAFVSRYPELAEKLRKYEVQRATGRAPGKTTGKPPAPRQEPQDDKQQSWSEFSKRIRLLQKGQANGR